MTDVTDISGEPTFEDFRHDNGTTYWWASDLQELLQYSSFKSFQAVVDRAIKGMMSMSMPHFEEIIAQTNPNTQKPDFRCSRFGCYMIVMNASDTKNAVRMAKTYFAAMTAKFEVFINNTNQMERLIIRDDIKEGNKALSAAAKSGRVLNYAAFTNAGYRGLYNMTNWQLAKRRNIPAKKLFDYMGRTELAANLFRITMTEERIKAMNIKGQHGLEQTHYQVGKQVRDVVNTNAGRTPENLPMEKRLPEVKKQIKKVNSSLSF